MIYGYDLINYCEDEKLYSTGDDYVDSLLEEAFYDGYNYAQREYTEYDETDKLKRMKDSDILAEKKRRDNGAREVIGAGLGTAAAGATAGLVTGIVGKAKNSPGWKSTGKYAGGVHTGARTAQGAIAGAALGTAIGLASTAKKRKKNREYNQRLEYAQRQAKRREGADWSSNNTQREGYTY